MSATDPGVSAAVHRVSATGPAVSADGPAVSVAVHGVSAAAAPTPPAVRPCIPRPPATPLRFAMSRTTVSPSAELTALASRVQDPDFLTAKQVASALTVAPDTVYRMARSGELPSYRVGNGRGLLRIPRADFRTYLRTHGMPASLAGGIGQSVSDRPAPPDGQPRFS